MSSDKELKETISRAIGDVLQPITKKMGEEFHRFEEHLQSQARIQLENHEATRREFQNVKAQMKQLWTSVKGSEPPPPPGARIEPLDSQIEQSQEKLSQHDLEIDSVKAGVIVVEKKVEDLRGDMTRLLALQEKQTSAMGLHAEKPKSLGESFTHFVSWVVTEKEGQKFILTVFTALTTLVGALGTLYALATGRLPTPTSPKPVPALVEPQ